MMTTSTIDTRKVEASVGKVLNDSSATFVTTLAAFGDRLGLFKSLATNQTFKRCRLLVTRAGAIDQMNSRFDLNRTRVLRPETIAGTLVPTHRVARLERGSRYILLPPVTRPRRFSGSPAVGVYGGRSRSRNFPMAIRNVPLKRDLCEGEG